MKSLSTLVLFAIAVHAGELTVAQRNDACYAQRGVGTPEAIAEMRRLLDDPDVRACAARNLREVRAAAQLIDALDTGAPDTRIAAARELGVLRDKRALPVLGRAALDPNALVASSAIGALGDYEDAAALPFLLKAAESATVAGIAALEQAARLHDPAVLPLARRTLQTGDVAAQVIALSILGDLGDAADIPRLQEMESRSEKVSVRGRGFGFMPAIDLARAAQTARKRIEQRYSIR